MSIDIDLAPDGLDEEHPVTLTLIDTPSLDFDDKHASERALQEILRHVEARLGESLEDVSAAPLLGAHTALTHPPRRVPRNAKHTLATSLYTCTSPFLIIYCLLFPVFSLLFRFLFRFRILSLSFVFLLFRFLVVPAALAYQVTETRRWKIK